MKNSVKCQKSKFAGPKWKFSLTPIEKLYVNSVQDKLACIFSYCGVGIDISPIVDGRQIIEIVLSTATMKPVFCLG